MGDSGINPEIPINPQILPDKKVTRGIKAALAGMAIMEAVTACAPKNAASIASEPPKTDPDKVLSVPPPTYGAMLVPIETPAVSPVPTPETPQTNLVAKEAEERAENNAKVLKDDLGLEKGSNYEVLPGGIILVTGGEYGFNDDEQVEAVRMAVEDWNKIDPEFSKKITERGVNAIAVNIAGYGEKGFWQQGRENWGLSYDPNKGVILVNSLWMYDQINDAKIGYMGSIDEEAWGIYYSKFLIPNPQALNEKIVWVDKAIPTLAEKQEKISLLNSWFSFKKNDEHLDEKRLLESYPFSADFKEALKSETGRNELLGDIRVVKLVASWSDLERYHSEGKIEDEKMYEDLQGRFLRDLEQVLRDHFRQVDS